MLRAETAETERDLFQQRLEAATQPPSQVNDPYAVVTLRMRLDADRTRLLANIFDALSDAAFPSALSAKAKAGLVQDGVDHAVDLALKQARELPRKKRRAREVEKPPPAPDQEMLLRAVGRGPAGAEGIAAKSDEILPGEGAPSSGKTIH